MSKKIIVDGLEVFVNECDLGDLREKFNTNVVVDDMDEWKSTDYMEKYDASTFITKARYYLGQTPPDLVQTAEKLWFSAVYALKELFLSCGLGMDLKSHKSLDHFCRFALNTCCTWEKNDYLYECWTIAEKMHRTVYGSAHIHVRDYPKAISDLEKFVKEVEKFDREKLWSQFEKLYVIKKWSNIEVTVDPHTVKLGGHDYKANYSVFT